MIGRAVLTMIGYAVFLVAGGLVAFLMAPPDANATTALLVPSIAAGLMLISAVLSSLMHRSKPVGMIGIHAGLVLPLIFTLGIGQRALATWSEVGDYTEQREAYEAAQQQPDQPQPDQQQADRQQAESFGAYLEAQGLADDVPDHDKTYLAVILTVLALGSAGAFVVLLLQRPKPEPKPEKAEAQETK